MIKRHSDQIWARLDQLYADGTTFFGWNEIYHWYGLKKIRKEPYRDIKQKWEELLNEKSESYADPLVANVPGGFTLFFAAKPGKLSNLAA